MITEDKVNSKEYWSKMNIAKWLKNKRLFAIIVKNFFDIKIRTQLLIGFIIPIIFVILIGVISYQKAKEGMCRNYESTAINSLDMATDYLDFGFDLVSADLLQFTLDSNLSKYATGVYHSKPAKENEVFTNIRSNMVVKESGNKFIESMLFIPGDQVNLISTNNAKGKGFYVEWAKTEEGKAILDSSKTISIVGRHNELDSITGVDSEQYALSCIGIMNNKAAIMVVDISKDAIDQCLEKLQFEAGSVAAYITRDNREIIVSESDKTNNQIENFNIAFSEQDFFIKMNESNQKNGSEYVSYQGSDYLFIYSKSEKYGGTVCALVPKVYVISKAKEINGITSMFVVLSCTIAAMIGCLIFLNISTGITKITRNLAVVSKGDLTVTMDVKGKSEFSVLSKDIMEMMKSMKFLITKVGDSINLASNSALQVGCASGIMNDSSTQITNSISEIDKGIGQQAEDLQSCLFQMDSLSSKIQSINSEVVSVCELADNSINLIGQSINNMEDLAEQSTSTSQVTTRVKNDIKELESKSAAIGSFVDIINSIAVQTNLLSLNASIEAARSGAAGKGFTVIAQEIRKLADESQRASSEILKIVEEIRKQTINTIVTANQAESIVEKQGAMVKCTIKDFQKMNHSTEELMVRLKKISVQLEDADAERGMTLEAFENISAISEETAVSSNLVNEIAIQQMENVESMKLAADELNLNMNELKQTLSWFKI